MTRSRRPLGAMAIRYAPPVLAETTRAPAEPSGASANPRAEPRFWRWWLAAFLVVAALGACWTLATPPMASPDEPTQVIKAAAVARGQLLGRARPGPPVASVFVRVPEVFVQYREPLCYEFRPTVPAGCAPPLGTATRTVTARTYVGRYPPLYFLLVGWPSLFLVSPAGIQAMRLASDLAGAALVALGLATIVRWSEQPLLLAGSALALTPSALFLTSVVNPSGFEVDGGIALWMCGVTLATRREGDAPSGLVAATAVAASALALTRGLSPLWVALIGVGLGVLAGRRRLAELARIRQVRVGLGALFLIGILATTWIFAEHTLTVVPVGSLASRRDTFLDAFRVVADQWLRQARGFVGIFGWLDTPAPLFTVLAWAAAFLGLVVAGLARLQLRQLAALVLTGVLVVTVPAAINAKQVHVDGIIWQARYTLPFAVGLPLLAAAIAARQGALAWYEQRSYRMGVVTVALLASLAQLAAFLEALVRNVRGLPATYAGYLHPFAHVPHGWAPPLSPWLLTGAFAFVVAVWAALVVLASRATLRRDTRRASPWHRPRHARPDGVS